MLNSATYWVLAEGDTRGMLVAIGLWLAGFVIGMIPDIRHGLKIGRLAFLAVSVLALILLAVANLVWLWFWELEHAGLGWIPLAVGSVACAGTGLMIAVAAQARGRSGWGNRAYGWIAAVPLLSLGLLLIAPMDPAPPNRLRLVLNPLILVALLALGLASQVLLRTSEGWVLARTEAYLTDPAHNGDLIAFKVHVLGLPAVLAEVAATTPTGRLDEATVLLRIETTDEIMRYVYEVDSRVTEVPYDLGNMLEQSACEDAVAYALMRAGGAIRHDYLGSDGQSLGSFDVTQDRCLM